MKYLRIKAAFAATGLALALAACGDAGSDEEGSDVEAEENAAEDFDAGTRMKELADNGKITIGVKFDQPGIGFKGATDTEPKGIDPESDKVEWKETISANREPYLEAGEVDLVLASYSITDERREVVGQTGPYFITGQQLMVKKGSDIKSVADIKGKEVCSVTGSTSLDNVEAEGAKPRGFDTYSECRDQVLDGTVDAMTTDGAILLGYVAINPDELEVVGDEFSEERIGVGYSKDSPEMCEWINGVLEDSFEDGTWDTAFEATLGKSGVETPEPPALDECAA